MKKKESKSSRKKESEGMEKYEKKKHADVKEDKAMIKKMVKKKALK